MSHKCLNANVTEQKYTLKKAFFHFVLTEKKLNFLIHDDEALNLFERILCKNAPQNA